MQTIFYGFNKATRMGAFTASSAVKEDRDYVVIPSEEQYDISAIRLADDNITIEHVMPTEQQLSLLVENKRAELVQGATAKIDLLRDIVEFKPTDEAETELAAWRAYRVDVHTASIVDVADFPVAPE